MRRLIEHRFLIRKNILALIGFCLCFYFTYHIVQGERSLTRYMALQTKIAEAEVRNESLTSQRREIEQDVVMLRPGSIDQDLLEERVRLILGFRHTEERDLIR